VFIENSKTRGKRTPETKGNREFENLSTTKLTIQQIDERYGIIVGKALTTIDKGITGGKEQ
jgi:hypothetical protein